METKLILPFIVSITPIIILAVYLFNPAGNAIRYFIPRFLPDREYPKALLRQAGSGCLFLSVWLFGIIVAVSSTTDFKALEKMSWLMALLFFIIPIVIVLFFCVGIYYLLIGVLAKSDNIRPKFQSVFCADKKELSFYVRKLKFYTALNLIFLFVCVLSLSLCAAYGKSVEGKLIPLNIICLIGFILTLWRIRAYIAKTAIAMDLPGRKYFLSTLFSPIGILFVWIHAFALIRKCYKYQPHTQN